jgi:quinol-cytochrome oxidoreductase complex cytochrome b subunit
MGAALAVLLLLPFINTSEIRSTFFRPIFKQFFWLFVADCLILGWIGQKPVESPYIEIGQIATGYYFFFFLVVIPFLGFFEKLLIKVATDTQEKKITTN